jgi:hypothetical protein
MTHKIFNLSLCSYVRLKNTTRPKIITQNPKFHFLVGISSLGS